MNFKRHQTKIISGLILVITLISCKSDLINDSDIQMIINQSTSNIISGDSLRFFPPMILSDELNDGILIKAEKQKYENNKTTYLATQKYIILPDSILITDSLGRHLKKIHTPIPVINRFYKFILNSNLNDLKKDYKILVQFSMIKIVLNDSKTSANLSYDLKCLGAENGGWNGNISLYKPDNNWIIKKITAHNISYPSSSAAVVFGGHLSARAAFRLDRKSPAVRPCV
jgi:hypothetical protein